MKTQIVLFEGFDELDAIAPYEVLRNAAAAGADLHVELATQREATEVTAAHGLRVRPHARLAAGGLDLLIVPGGGWNNRAPAGARAEAERGELPAAIARLHHGGATAAAVCTGAMLLAAAGLTAGRPAITHHAALDDLRATGAVITPARVVDDGDVITAGGVTSGLDLALWVVERWFGAPAAADVERRMEYERRGVVWRKV
jgi:transcriptional regulator GlxA family with amidase domain